jgi:hypothetical protein
MDSNMQDHKPKKLVIQLSPLMEQLLGEAAARAKRSYSKEAAVRIEDHLMNFGDIATVGKRFDSK